jgi:hypothetical protein
MTTNPSYTAAQTLPLDGNKLSVLKALYLLLAASALALGLISMPANAESDSAHPNYRYIKPVVEENKTGEINQDTTEKPTLADKKISLEAVEKPSDGKGAMPTFDEADIDSDHYVTKAELKNFPYLLQVFDKVDAGEDGKLEQHEYQNLKMETKREAEVR